MIFATANKLITVYYILGLHNKFDMQSTYQKRHGHQRYTRITKVCSIHLTQQFMQKLLIKERWLATTNPNYTKFTHPWTLPTTPFFFFTFPIVFSSLSDIYSWQCS